MFELFMTKRFGLKWVDDDDVRLGLKIVGKIFSGALSGWLEGFCDGVCRLIYVRIYWWWKTFFAFSLIHLFFSFLSFFSFFILSFMT